MIKKGGSQLEIAEKIERFKELFKEDPLYQEIENRDLIDELFAPCYLYERVFFDSTYSTKQATELLEIPGKEQTLLNFLNRNDFTSYIDIFRQGSRGFYRYNYKTLFQFKMILLLSNYHMTPSDIAAILNLRPEYKINEPFLKRTNVSKLPPTSQVNIEELVQKETSKALGAMVPYIKKLEHTLAKQNLDLWESEMRSLVRQIEDVELNISMYKIMVDHLTTVENQVKHSKSLFSKIFGSKNQTNPINLSEYELNLEKFKELHKKLIERKEKMDGEKDNLTGVLDQTREQARFDQTLETSKEESIYNEEQIEPSLETQK
jgi:hypothetical protein